MRDDFSNIIPLYEICIRCIREFPRDKYFIIKLPKIGNNSDQKIEKHKTKQSKAEKDKQDINKAKSKCTNQRIRSLKAYAS